MRIGHIERDFSTSNRTTIKRNNYIDINTSMNMHERGTTVELILDTIDMDK